jgi:tetratricopeptide (TPR) repeat protein
MAKNTTKIEDKAVRAVGDYIDDCPKLKSYCQSNDKTPVWDGDIFIYKSKEEHNVKNIFARVPLQIKGTTNTEDDFYRIEREYIEAYQAERGCVFFMVQEDKETYKPIRILYAMLALEDVNALLQLKTQTIKIDLKEAPANPRDFETELTKFAKKRNGEMIDNPAPKEIASLVEEFKEIEKHLDEVEDKGARIELKSFIDTIIGLKNDGTVGWRDTFVHLSRKALDIASKHIKGYDFLYLQHNLGLYLYQQKLYHLVEDYYVQSLKEFRERATANPDAFLPDVAMTLNNLATLHSVLNRFEMAEKEYKEALEIRRKLAEANPDAFLPDVAATLNNLAALHWDLNRFEMAEKEFKEALEIQRKLAEANPDAFLPDVAETLFNIALLRMSEHRQDEAKKACEEALEIYKAMAKKAPQKWNKYVDKAQRELDSIIHS